MVVSAPSLDTDEKLIANARLHDIGYMTALLFPLLGWVTAYYFPAVVGTTWSQWICLAGILGGACLMFLSYIEHKTSEIYVTERRIFGSVGTTFSRETFDIAAGKITGINVSQSLLGRLCGYGTVLIQCAPDHSIRIHDVDHPIDFQQKLIASLKKKQNPLWAEAA